MRKNRKPLIIAAAIPLLGLGWYLFRPELAFVNEQVNENLPVAAGQKIESIGQGSFASYAHETTGKAEVLSVDGKPLLRLSNFKTSNGPDVRVLLVKGTNPKQFSDTSYLDLGTIKGNVGNQNYSLPAGTNPADYQSVTIWCKRFNVSFGGAVIESTMAEKTSQIVIAQPVAFRGGNEIRVTSGNLTGGRGLAELIESKGARSLRIAGFQSKTVKAADVYLVKAETLGKSFDFNALTKVKLGTWSAGKATQQFSVDKEFDLWLYRSVVLWDSTAKKPIATANLRSDQEKAKKVQLI